MDWQRIRETASAFGAAGYRVPETHVRMKPSA